MRSVIRCGVSVALLASSVGAAAQERYEAVEGLTIADVIGTVELRFTDRDDVSVDVTGGDDRSLSVSNENGVLTVGGPERVDEEAFWDAYGGSNGVRIGRVRLMGGGVGIRLRDGRDARFEEMLADYPRVVIEAPRGTALTLRGSAALVRAQGEAGALDVPGNVYLRAALGDVGPAKVAMTDRGAVTMGAVAGDLEVALTGSGDVTFAAAEAARVVLRGSGDVEGGDVAGALSVDVRGSGDVIARRVDGPLTVRIQGSGDVEVDEATSIDIEVEGSGDVVVREVEGAVRAVLRGSGDIDLGDGRAERFEADLAGSGDIAFGGVAVNPTLRARGSGDIDLREAEGPVDAQGRNITVGGRSYDRD